jgi:transposase InsO family protein
MNVSVSGFHAWRRRRVGGAGKAGKRASTNDGLLVQIRAIHAETKQRYGSRKMHRALARTGIHVNHKRVARLMQQNGLVSRRFKRRRLKVTTDSNHDLPVAPNVLNREFTADRPNVKWVSDITYVPTHEGWLYLAVVLDLFSRRVVGWAMSERMTRQLVIDAFEMAMQSRAISTTATGATADPSKLLFHSDRGGQYASDDFIDLIGVFDITQSMSRKADCWDNAVAESFWASYKAECLPEDTGAFDTRAQAKTETFEYIDVFYNRKRIHSTLGYLTPAEFDANAGVT